MAAAALSQCNYMYAAVTILDRYMCVHCMQARDHTHFYMSQHTIGGSL